MHAWLCAFDRPCGRARAPPADDRGDDFVEDDSCVVVYVLPYSFVIYIVRSSTSK